MSADRPGSVSPQFRGRPAKTCSSLALQTRRTILPPFPRAMKTILSVLLLLASHFAAAASDHHLIIGDSLSKEYEIEGPGIGIDVFPPPSPYPKNWCELLDRRRPDFFDYGDLDVHSDIRAAGHDYNWSVPGSYASDWRDTYLANPPGALESQLSQTLVKRCVIWLGGNDVRDSYGGLYNGDINPAAWATKTFSDIAFVVDWVLDRRQPGVQMVLVNVAHLGATIAKNRDFPYDAVKTGRVTAAIEDLNTRMALLAQARGIGLADIYRMTKELVTADRWCIGGWLIYKKSSGDGDADAMFLNDGFHPNMPVQAVFGQTILDTFNSRYGTAIPRLTNREIVDKCLEENPSFTFTQWVTNYGIPAADRSPLADPDGDTITNIVEFGLDLDPARPDSHLLPQPRLVSQDGREFVTLTWQPRDPTNATWCEITPQQSGDLITWTDVPAASIVSSSPNVKTASVPAASGQPVWLRLKVRQVGP